MAAEVIRSCKRHRSRSRKYFHSGGKHPLLTGCELAKLRLALIGANGLRELLPPRIDYLIEVTQDRAQIWTPRNISEKCLCRFTISVSTSIFFKQSQTDHGSCDDTQCPRWSTGTGRKLSKTCRTSRKCIKYSDFGRRKKVLRGHEAHGNFHNGFRCDRHDSLCWMVQFRPADDQPPLSGPSGMSPMGPSLRFLVLADFVAVLRELGVLPVLPAAPP